MLKKRELKPNFDFENELKSQGIGIICGVDEAGRGAWAGPLIAAAVILATNIETVRDSKLLDPKRREEIALEIKQTCKWGIGEVTAEEIDVVGISKANLLSFERAIENLHIKTNYALVDGLDIELSIPHQSIIKGDMKCSSIAAASIIAKTHRDQLMNKIDGIYPGYYFAQHKGYGTKLHQLCLEKNGASEIHRKTYAPIKKYL